MSSLQGKTAIEQVVFMTDEGWRAIMAVNLNGSNARGRPCG